MRRTSAFLIAFLIFVGVAHAQLGSGSIFPGFASVSDKVGNAAGLANADTILLTQAAGTAKESDVKILTGVLTRAGALGLAATGANSLTFATNGVTRLTIDSAGTSTFAGKVIVPYSTRLSFIDSGGAEGFRIYTNDGVTGNAAVINQANNSYIGIYTLNLERMRITAGGNILFNTTTDNGQRLQLATGNILLSDGYGILYDAAGNMQQLGSVASGFTWKTAATQKMALATDGTLTLANATAVTGVSKFAINGGAGQASTPMAVYNALSGGYALFQYQEATVAKYTGGMDDLERFYLYDNTNTRNVYLYTPSTGVLSLNTAGGEVSIAAAAGKLGFFGTAPVVKQTATADAASILALLQAYGLSN